MAGGLHCRDGSRAENDWAFDPRAGVGHDRVFAEKLVGLGVLCSVSYRYIKPIPTHEKSGPNATFHLFFLGLGWP